MPEHETLPPFAGSVIDHVGTYRRVLPVSLERMYENALDWEHLPHQHASSFQAIECLAAGNWGWRARVTNPGGHQMVIELRLDRACRRWITRTLEGPNAGTEIWTHAFPIEARRVDIVVDFFVPGVAAAEREKVGRAMAALYTRLYDEDVSMMVERQRQLDRRVMAAPHDERRLVLGARARLALPQVVALGGRDYVVCEDQGELVAYPAVCPHQLGPLTLEAPQQGIVTCPWHGYRFDVRSGDCVSGQGCRLNGMPRVVETDGVVELEATH